MKQALTKVISTGAIPNSGKLGYGLQSHRSQTQAGGNFVARMLTVVTTLKSQQRNVLEFLTSAVVAARIGKPAPSLLPEVAPSCLQKGLLKAA